MVRRPDPRRWRDWSYEDYLRYFLGRDAARRRLRPGPSIVDELDRDELHAFAAPVRERIRELYGTSAPRVSISMPAYREEREILPTLVSWTRVNVRPGEAELIVVDNANTDRTAEIIRACGARYVHCGEPGVGHARAAGVAAAAESAEYLWLLDADVRLLPPYRRERDLAARSSVLRTSLEFMDIHPTYVGISTGSLTESAHWLYRLAHSFAVRTGRSRRYSCWSGHNQFVRRSALEAIGGIDEEVEWNDDQHRHHELARYAKRTGGHLASANRMPETADPVYHSGRRYATLGLCLRHFREAWSRAELPRDEHGYPVHARNRDWRKVRID